MYVHMEDTWKMAEGISESSYWPEEGPIDNRDIGYENKICTHRLDLCLDGTLSLRKFGEKSFNGAAIPVYRHDDPDVLKSVQTLMCRRGYASANDPRLTHEGGTRYYFSWLSTPMPGTAWQINAVQRIIHIFVSTGDASAAHAEGKRLAGIVERAAQKLYEKHHPDKA